MKKELEIAFRSHDYSDNYEIDKVIIELTPEDINLIKEVSKLTSRYNNASYVAVYFTGDFKFKDEEGTENESWRTDVQYLKVYSENSIFLYAQCKYDSGDQLESEEFSINVH